MSGLQENRDSLVMIYVTGSHPRIMARGTALRFLLWRVRLDAQGVGARVAGQGNTDHRLEAANVGVVGGGAGGDEFGMVDGWDRVAARPVGDDLIEPDRSLGKSRCRGTRLATRQVRPARRLGAD